MPQVFATTAPQGQLDAVQLLGEQSPDQDDEVQKEWPDEPQ